MAGDTLGCLCHSDFAFLSWGQSQILFPWLGWILIRIKQDNPCLLPMTGLGMWLSSGQWDLMSLLGGFLERFLCSTRRQGINSASAASSSSGSCHAARDVWQCRVIFHPWEDFAWGSSRAQRDKGQDRRTQIPWMSQNHWINQPCSWSFLVLLVMWDNTFLLLFRPFCVFFPPCKNILNQKGTTLKLDIH